MKIITIMYPPNYLLASNFTLGDGFGIAGIVLLVLLSAFFSASETAFSAVNPLRIKSYADDKVKGGRRAQYVVEHFDFALVCLLVGNNLVNIASTTLCAYMFTKFVASPTIASLLNTLVMTIIILIAGEILPKAYAKHNPEKFALGVSGIIYVFMKVIYVLAIPFYGLQKLAIGKKKEQEPTITEDELETIVDTMEEEGVIDSDNAEMLQGVLDIQERTVYEIMVPRVDMVAVSVDATIDDLKENFVENQYSRLPVYEGDKDDIIGVLNQKDVTISQYKGEPLDIRKLMTAPLKVPKSMKVDDLITQMRQTKKHLAIVIDEYGGTSGLVTMEDALEEVFGEIYDEHDDAESEPIVKLEKGKYRVDPDISVEELFEYLEIEHLPDTKYASVGGMVYGLLERVAKVGDKVSIIAIDEVLNEHNDYVATETELTFEVKATDDDRIAELELVTHVVEKDDKDK